MGRGARVLRRVALVLALATATACQQAQLQAPFASQPPAQLPLQLEIPDGYRGYVVLQYALASCAVLPRRDGYTVIRFTDDGRAYVLEPRLSAKKRAHIEATLDAGERRCFAALTAAERGELLRLLDKCIADLDAEAT